MKDLNNRIEELAEALAEELESVATDLEEYHGTRPLIVKALTIIAKEVYEDAAETVRTCAINKAGDGVPFGKLVWVAVEVKDEISAALEEKAKDLES